MNANQIQTVRRTFALTVIRRFQLPLLAALLACTGSLTQVGGTTYTWTAGSWEDINPGNNNNLWANPANWWPNGVPGTGDTALVGTVPHGNPDPVGSLTLAGLQISGGAAVTVTSLTVDVLSLTNGNLYGGAVTFSGATTNAWTWAGGTISGTFVLQSGLRADFTGPGAQTFRPGTTLDNDGEIVWSGGSLYLGYGAALRNTGVFVASTDDILFNHTGGAPAPCFLNEGVLQKTAGAGTLTFRTDNGGVYLTNSGVVDIQMGTLSLPGFADFGPGGALSGAGTVSLEGQATVSGASTVASNTTLRLTGLLIGRSATLTGEGTFRWAGGRLQGELTLDTNLICVLQGAATKVLDPNARVWQRGPARWEDTGQLHLGYGALWENAGQFDVFNDTDCYMNTGGTPTPEFLNTGRLRKLAGTGTTTWRVDNGGVRFSGSGVVEVQSGTLQLNGGGALTNAAFQIAPGAMAGFGGGYAFTWRTGAAFSGGGRARVNGATIILDDIACDVATNSTFELAGGTLAGRGSFTGTGLFAWTGGNLDAQLTVPASLAFDISGGSAKTFQPNAALTNLAAAVWRDDGDLYFGWGSVFHNAGSLEIRNDRVLFKNTGGAPAPLFENLGTLIKTAGGGTTTFHPDNGGVTLTNAGVVDIRTGVLSLAALAQFGPGSTLAGAGTISFDNNTALFGTSHLSNGNLRLTATFNAAGGFDGNGNFEWRAGTLNGTLELGAGVTLDVAGSSPKTLSTNASLTHHGLAILSGPGQLNLGWGVNWNNRGTFEARTNGLFYMNTGSTPAPAFNNAGTFRCQPPGGALTFHSDNGGVRMNNAGSIEVLRGTLSLGGGGANTNGLFRVAAGAQLDFAARTNEFRDGARLLVDGLARLNGATITCYDTTNTISAGGEINMSAGTLAGAQTVTGPGLFRWTGGSLSGTQTVLAGTGFEISGAANKLLNPGARLNNLTSATWLDAGQIHCGWGSVFGNVGTLDAQSDGGFYNNTGGSPTPLFENTGTLRKSAGALTRFRPDNGGVALTNAGVVDVQAGILSLQGGVALGAGGSFTGAGVAGLDSQTTLHGTNSIGPGATLRLASTLYGSGRFDGAGTFNWDSGVLDGVFEIASALSLTSGNTKTLRPGAQLTTAGTSAWTGGQIHLGAGAILANRGTFEVRCDSVFYMNTGGLPLPVVTNSGTFRKLASTGATTFRSDNGGVTFANAGTVDLRSGTLQLDAGYIPSAGAPFAFLLSGPASGADYGRVSRSGALPCNGPLTVTLASGYTPTAGTVFTLASYTTRSGSFHPVNLPSLPAPLQWALDYLPTTLQLRVLAGEPHLQMTQPAWLPGGTFQSLIVGSNVNAVVVQATTNFHDWLPLSTNLSFTGDYLFTDPSAGAFSNRFYRAKQYP